MRIFVTKNYQELSYKAADIVEDYLKNSSAVLGLATGSTPMGLYRELISRYENNGLSFQNVQTINLDEYIGLDRNHLQSYHTFMRENFFSHIDIPSHQTHIPNGLAEPLDVECSRYEKLINEIGPPDVQVLGIGENGHIGFNEPGSKFSSETHVIQLASSTRKANARFFDSVDQVPTHAITMGIKSILKSRQILLLASGTKKAAAIKRLLDGGIDEKFPASALLQHSDVVLIADREAWSEVSSSSETIFNVEYL
ncbi:glucosamine-6-phosphate deaminase [Jeotgalibacillus proteolyticus]|uniref:Glucosamine-6-phosphate deaminase n=1 Tax=Jeotgalibacillus proteolyticus TaxID=2082395 RepID=A0A2S5G9Z0_9BACL|nr:glucosamine-6-phosphate deaminase [Jeotgalibacillus proteolyticus]PPA69810.1 glucosamine-6-phosphate deaminase [Jeotgalibacillus proteolyticus]